MIEPATLTLAYILDLAMGDPRRLPHPVRVIGWVTTKMESLLRRMIQNSDYRTQKTVASSTSADSPRREHRLKNKETREKLAGVFLVTIIVGSTHGLFSFINTILLNSYFSVLISYLSFILLTYLISTTLATRELLKSAQSVIKALKDGSIGGARKNLSCIVGRDSKTLDRNGILKATIESLAENASDGIVAPLFYLSIGGLPLAISYKAINTLDSMVGYKNEKYKNFGWAAARLDDIANYIPARITGVLIVISTFILNRLNCSNRSSRSNCLDGLNSFRIMLRDGRNHLSPNSGVPEAAMAGALGIRLGGPSFYEGIIVEKPFIGEDLSDSSRWFKIAQNGLNLNNVEPLNKVEQPSTRPTDSYERYYLQASEKALLIIKLTSILGLGMAVSLTYLRALI